MNERKEYQRQWVARKRAAKRNEVKPGNDVDSSDSDNLCDEKVSKLSASTSLPSYVVPHTWRPESNRWDNILDFLYSCSFWCLNYTS